MRRLLSCLLAATLMLTVAPAAAATAEVGPISGADHTISGHIDDGRVYDLYVFTDDGAIDIPAEITVDLLLLGGGGGGGMFYGGGGGAGGLLTIDDVTLPAGSYPVHVGAGGAGSPNRDGQPTSGEDTRVDGVLVGGADAVAVGGGAGQHGNRTHTIGSFHLARSGGSGGGGVPDDPAGSGTASQGHEGSSAPSGGGGGGSAGPGTRTTTLGNGGPATDVSDTFSNALPGGSLLGAGGDGGQIEPSDGGAHTGDGGEGSWASGASPPRGGHGGSGLVVVRHQIGQVPTISASFGDVTGAGYGDEVTLTVETAGDPTPEIVWHRRSLGGSSSPIAGETGPELTFIADVDEHGTRYYAVVANTFGMAETLETTLQVDAGPPLTAEPFLDSDGDLLVEVTAGLLELTDVHMFLWHGDQPSHGDVSPSLDPGETHVLGPVTLDQDHHGPIRIELDYDAPRHPDGPFGTVTLDVHGPASPLQVTVVDQPILSPDPTVTFEVTNLSDDYPLTDVTVDPQGQCAGPGATIPQLAAAETTQVTLPCDGTLDPAEPVEVYATVTSELPADHLRHDVPADERAWDTDPVQLPVAHAALAAADPLLLAIGDLPDDLDGTTVDLDGHNGGGVPLDLAGLLDETGCTGPDTVDVGQPFTLTCPVDLTAGQPLPDPAQIGLEGTDLTLEVATPEVVRHVDADLDVQVAERWDGSNRLPIEVTVTPGETLPRPVTLALGVAGAACGTATLDDRPVTVTCDRDIDDLLDHPVAVASTGDDNVVVGLSTRLDGGLDHEGRALLQTKVAVADGWDGRGEVPVQLTFTNLGTIDAPVRHEACGIDLAIAPGTTQTATCQVDRAAFAAGELGFDLGDGVVGAPSLQLDLTGPVTFRFIDSDGTPIAGVRVELTPQPPTGNDGSTGTAVLGTTAFSGTSGPDGTVVLEGVPAGPFTARAYAPDGYVFPGGSTLELTGYAEGGAAFGLPPTEAGSFTLTATETTPESTPASAPASAGEAHPEQVATGAAAPGRLPDTGHSTPHLALLAFAALLLGTALTRRRTPPAVD